VMDMEKFKKGVLAVAKRIREIERPDGDYDACSFDDYLLGELEGYVETGCIDNDSVLMETLNKIFEE
jgi:hypothetical protein